MRTRALSLALALLFAVSAAVTATPAACCVSTQSAERTLLAVDCCASMVECPLRWKAAGPAVVQSDVGFSWTAVLLGASESPALAGETDPTTSLPAPTADGPPLYRLHAQLLI